MFSIGFSEVIMTFLVGCLVINPKDLPGIIRDVKIYYRKFIRIRDEVVEIAKNVQRKAFDDETESSTNTKHIIGDDGNVYEAYDIKDIVKNREKNNNDS